MCVRHYLRITQHTKIIMSEVIVVWKWLLWCEGVHSVRVRVSVCGHICWSWGETRPLSATVASYHILSPPTSLSLSLSPSLPPLICLLLLLLLSLSFALFSSTHASWKVAGCFGVYLIIYNGEFIVESKFSLRGNNYYGGILRQECIGGLCSIYSVYSECSVANIEVWKAGSVAVSSCINFDDHQNCVCKSMSCCCFKWKRTHPDIFSPCIFMVGG